MIPGHDVRPPSVSAVLAVLALTLAGCGGEASAPAERAGPRAHLVEVAVAEAGRLEFAADRPGSLRALREVKIVNQEEGQLIEVGVREGDHVTAGQILARYDDRIPRAELDKARASLAQADAEHARAARLVAEGFISAEAMTRAQTAQELARAEVRLLETRWRHMTLTAPMSGVVSRRLVEPGDATARHSHLLTLVDPTRLVTDVSVSELALPLLRAGGAARVRIDALGDTLHPGRILRIHPTLDPGTRTGIVEVELLSLPPGALPGQFCRVTFAAEGPRRVIVPLAALQRDAAGEFVFVLQGEDSVHRAPVNSGLRLADRVEIASGLQAGDRVVVRGFLELAGGRKVRVVAPVDAAPVGAAAGGG